MPRKKPAPKKLDRATQYAHDVVKGKIVAGPSVRGICKRHLDDLKRGDDFGYYYDEGEAAHFIGFIEDMLTVEVDNKTAPFKLINWQAFCVASLFGWMREDNGARRFRTSYIETGKGSGKSPLAAAIGLAGMVADGVASAEVYAAATIKAQAMILFRDATNMIKRSPELLAILHPSGGNPIWQWTHRPTGSFFKPLSQDEAVSGPRPSVALIDEYHEHKTPDAVEMLEAGFKGRSSPLLFVITNSGSDLKTPCGEMHDWAIKVARGTYDKTDQAAADVFFAFITDLDEKDDPFKDEKCWIKANPSLGVTIQPDYLRKQVESARAMPSKQNKVLRLNFCRWTDSAKAWITRAAWEKCEETFDPRKKFSGKKIYQGIDLAYRTDLSAKACVYTETIKGKAHYWAWVDFYKPEDGLQAACDLDKVRYDLWAKAGFITLTKGPVIQLKPIAEDMAADQEHYSLQSTAYDAYRFKEMRDDLEDMEIRLPLVEHPQGFRRAKTRDETTDKLIDNPLWMPGSCQELENAIAEKRLHVLPNPVLQWNVSGAVIREDEAGNWHFDKKKATARIDGLVALAQAVGAAKIGREALASASPWEDEEFSLADEFDLEGVN